MDFTPTEEQTAVRDLAAQLLATGTPAEVGLAGFDQPLWARLGESGLLGMALPEAVDGGGLGLAEACVVAEETGRAAARVPVVHVLAALQTIATTSGDRHADLLRSAVAGSAVVVPALAEHGVGDPLSPSVRATRDGDGWSLTGTRLAVPWAREASHLVVSATDESGEALLALVAVPGPGITLEDEVVSSQEPHATVLLDGALVVDVLATGGEQLGAALTRTTLLQCAHAVGVAEQALALAASHVSTREQFGKPLAAFQAVTCRVADMWIDVEAMRLTLQQAVWRVDEGLPAAEQTATAAFWAAEGVQRVTSSAVHLHGGLGVDVSFPLHRWFLAGKVDELGLGGALRSLERLGDLLAAR
ncbi:MAG: 3-oxocholest-4-en-26-oyl-CoA dehydrogenase beta subunit [Actinomycetota bacterium]|jgi:alkylation response protein AidB-like acyl-CoA dehydrogenase|nr:3-oxocholest-4-en-26-oyl-CoA dehydrogenase beta subunit [Actinomycetota bacterium]